MGIPINDLRDFSDADKKALEAELAAAVEKAASTLAEEAKGSADAPTKQKVGVLIEKLIGSGIIDWTRPKNASKATFMSLLRDEINSISPDVIKDMLAIALPSAGPAGIGLLTASVVSEFVDKVCVTRSRTAADGDFANRTPLAASDYGGAHVDFLYKIESLPKIVDKDDGTELSDEDIERLIQDAFNVWVRKSDTLKFMAAADVTANAGRPGAVKANLTIQCIPIDGSGKKIAESTFGQGGRAAGISHYEIFIDGSESWTHDRFRAMIVHEIGHLFGLDDSTDRNEVMYGFLSEPYNKLAPTESDVKKFKQLGWG